MRGFRPPALAGMANLGDKAGVMQIEGTTTYGRPGMLIKPH